MARYELIYLQSIERDLRRLPKTDVRRILQKTELLRNDPFPPGAIKLAGQDCYRIRQGNYRILYHVDDRRIIVTVVGVGHRSDVYRR